MTIKSSGLVSNNSSDVLVAISILHRFPYETDKCHQAAVWRVFEGLELWIQLQACPKVTREWPVPGRPLIQHTAPTSQCEWTYRARFANNPAVLPPLQKLTHTHLSYILPNYIVPFKPPPPKQVNVPQIEVNLNPWFPYNNLSCLVWKTAPILSTRILSSW